MHNLQGPFRTVFPLVLASASPRRQMLLSSLGIHFSIIPCTQKEPTPKQTEDPAAYVKRTAKFKAQNVARIKPQAAILAADTVVILDTAILGKPKDRKQALMMLSQLNGRSHEVLTACYLILPEQQSYEFCIRSVVHFADWSEEILTAYAATDEPMDKAGAYALQGIGGFLIDRIDGSHSNVIGLPMSQTTNILLQAGVIA